MLIMHKPTNGKPGFFILFFVGPRDMANIRSARNLSEDKKENDVPFVCTCGSNTLKFQVDILNIERASQKCQFPIFLSCGSYIRR